MLRQQTIGSASSSKDKDHVPYLKTLKKTLSALAQLARKQRVCKTMFESIRITLETVDGLLESSDCMRLLFRRGKEFENRELSDNEQNRLRNLLEIEANLPKLNKICAALIYSADAEDENKYRLARKFVGLYDAPHKYAELKALFQRISACTHNLAADEDISEEAEDYFENFNEIEAAEIESKDAARIAEKIDTHLSTMINHRFFANECRKAQAKFEIEDIDTSSMDGLVDYISNIGDLKSLRRNLLIEVYKFGAKTKVQLIEDSVDNFKETFLGYNDINLEKLYYIEKHSEYTRRFQKPYIVSCFGYFNDPTSRGFQLCSRYPDMTLEDYINASDSFSGEIVFRFILQIIDAVKFSHESLEPVGDLRPKSILVKDGKKPQLLLLSVNADLDHVENKSNEEMLDLARYMAPELLIGHDDFGFDRKTKTGDVYAIGMLLWELMQKRKPYSSVDDFEHLIQLKSKGSHPSKMLDEEDDLISHLEYHNLLDEFFSQTWNPQPIRRPIPMKLTKKKSALKKILKTL